MNQEALVLADIARIQDYVLSPRILKLNRGASQLIKEANEKELPGIVTVLGGRVIYANGGNVMAVLPRDRSADFRLEAERTLRRLTGIAMVRTAAVDYPNPNEFPVKCLEIRTEMARVKSSSIPPAQPGSMPFWNACGACGLYPAIGWSKYVPSRCLCRACHLREGASDRYELKGKHRLAEDFDQIASCSSPAGYLALVYLDLDGMADYFEKEAESEERLAELAERIDRALTQAVQRARSGADLSEVLLIGGDDAAVVVPAQHAFGFLEAFRSAFREEYCRPLESRRQLPSSPTVSAGVVLAHSHFPISEFLRIAKRLLRSAKKIQGEDSIDYEIITTSISEDPLYNRARVAELGAGCFRTAKPYSLDRLLELKGELQKLKSSAPANKIKSLYRIAFRGRRQADLDYLFQLSRLDETSAGTLRRLIGDTIWEDLPDGRTVTHAADLAELWEFV